MYQKASRAKLLAIRGSVAGLVVEVAETFFHWLEEQRIGLGVGLRAG